MGAELRVGHYAATRAGSRGYELPTLTDCPKIGVAECGNGFARDPDRPGGCLEIFPDCADGSLASTGAPDCDHGFTCSTPVEDADFETLYVDIQAAAGGNGEPFQRIADAIAAAASKPNPRILVSPGRYPESLRIDHRVEITGACPTGVLVAGDSDQPAIEIGPGADGAGILGLEIASEQASAGVRVNGAEDVDLVTLLIGPVAGPGVEFEDTKEPTSGLIQAVAIQRAQGAGIAIRSVSSLPDTRCSVLEHGRALSRPRRRRS